MNPALERGLKKALRTLIQLAASGALTAAVTALAGGLTPAVQSLIATGWMIAVTFAQNAAEAAGKIPVLLPTVGIIPIAATASAVAADVAGTVEAVADTAGVVTGTVADVTGTVVGAIRETVIGRTSDEGNADGV
jgi:hypothetical protein